MNDGNRYGSYREAFEVRKKKELIIKAVAAVIILCLLVVVIKKIKYSDFIISRQEKDSKVTSKELEQDENYYSVSLDGYLFEDISSTTNIGKRLEMNNSDENLMYSIAYPEIGSEAIDSSISDHITTLAADFLKDYSGFDASVYGVKASLNVDYRSYLAGDTIVSVVFYEEYDTPGYAEPVQKVETYSYLLKTEEEIGLSDMMKGDYLKLLSDKTAEYLENDVRFMDSMHDKAFKKNYKAIEENFKLFAFSKASLILYFEPYKIAPAEFGIITVEIDAADLREHMKFNAFRYVEIPLPTAEPATESAVYVGDDVSVDINTNDNIDPNKPMVAFTFDDGPRAESTGKILDVLEQYGAHATFFLVGNRIDYNQDLVQREYTLGCDVANHSYSHAKLSDLKGEKIEKEIEKTNSKLKKVIGTGASLVRTPYGESSSKVLKYVNYPVILWDIDTLDWKSRNAKKVVKKIMKNVSDGDIILMHDIYDSTADAVEQVVPQLIENGYQIVSVSELLRYKGIEPKPHKTYFSVKSQ